MMREDSKYCDKREVTDVGRFYHTPGTMRPQRGSTSIST